MAQDQDKGLLQRLFDKSGDELEKIEGAEGMAAPPQEPAQEAMPVDEEFNALLDASPISARRYLQERQEAGDISPEEFESLKLMLPEDQQMKLEPLEEEPQAALPSMQGAEGLAQYSDPEFDEAFEGGHPGFQEFEGTIEATPEEEAALAKEVVKAREFIFSEDNYPKVLSALNTQSKEFFEAAADTAFALTHSQHIKEQGRGRSKDPAIYFGKGGMIENMVDTMFEIAQHHNIVGSDDPNQYAGAMGYAFQRAGEYVMESGDEEAILEAQEVMMDVALTKRDGTKIETREEAEAMLAEQQGQQNLQQSIQQGLQGNMQEQSYATPRANGAPV
jgi:hypothetical protein